LESFFWNLTVGVLTLALLGAAALLLAMGRRIRENEAKVRRMNRTLRSIRECDKALVLARDEPSLLKDVCRIMIEEGGYRLVWVGYAEQDEGRTVRPVAQEGFEVGYLEDLHITWADDEFGRGPAGIAIRTGQPSVARDILTEPSFAPWRQQALGRGFVSVIALPLVFGTTAFGTLVVYSGQAEAFDGEETALLAELTGSLSYGILALRDREAKEKAQEERRHLEAELQHLQRIQVIGRLAGGIAHDMNNVLAAIMAVADLIKDGKEDPAAQAELILEATHRGRGLVKGLLDFARKEVQAAEPVDLNRLVRQEAGILASTTLNRIRVELDLDEHLPRLLGSSLAIATLLMNLCVNSVDAMPTGGFLILRTREDERGILLEVEDTGHGMAPEVLDRAVEPFYTTKPMGKGTGLGLAVVFGTVQAHGGTLDIRSQPGKGTCVRIRFPVLAILPLQPAAPEHPAARFPGLRLLLVDDDPLVREATCMLLTRLGHQVTVAADGFEAVLRVEQGQPWDAVLLDLNMPGLDGLETLRRIRSSRPDTPVMVTSGYVDDWTREQLEALPPMTIVAKPCPMDKLQAALARLVGGARNGLSSPPATLPPA
jgi:signal transduction histidine kinase/ActR/RegA family two-component response regulator